MKAIAAVVLGALVVQPAPSLDVLLGRMGAYLQQYERQLSEVTADERYQQQEFFRERSFNRQTVLHSRRIESEIAFVRLPGDGYWFGLRDTRTVDGKPVAASVPRLADMVAGTIDLDRQRLALMAVSSRHNLGIERSINMPTVPLEVLQAQYQDLLAFRLEGHERVRGVNTMRIAFEEIGESTLILHVKIGRVKTRGRAWVESSTGRILRAEIDCRDAEDTKEGDLSGNFTVRVDFTMDRGLGFLVPMEMSETFPTSTGRGSGRATYTNFRRFQTSARIVPQ